MEIYSGNKIIKKYHEIKKIPIISYRQKSLLGDLGTVKYLTPLKKDTVNLVETEPLARMSYHKIKNNPNIYDGKPAYQIDVLLSTGQGTGTNSVQKVVKESLADNDTNGRVFLIAECIDGHSYPSGFYYKLGFRYRNDYYNNQLEKWLNNGGNRKFAPTMSGMMYLPEENIEHCLNYRKNNIK